jgi:hypothetical protein
VVAPFRLALHDDGLGGSKILTDQVEREPAHGVFGIGEFEPHADHVGQDVAFAAATA